MRTVMTIILTLCGIFTTSTAIETEYAIFAETTQHRIAPVQPQRHVVRMAVNAPTYSATTTRAIHAASPAAPDGPGGVQRPEDSPAPKAPEAAPAQTADDAVTAPAGLTPDTDHSLIAKTVASRLIALTVDAMRKSAHGERLERGVIVPPTAPSPGPPPLPQGCLMV
ncbi:hypothetical protein JCM16814_14870 [Desulfobaculum senezii]